MTFEHGQLLAHGGGLIEHEMGVISRVCDRCIVLNFGRKICEGDFQSVVNDRGVQEAYLGTEEPA